MLDLEIGEDASVSICDCCAGESRTGHGFVYKNGAAYAVYYAAWSPVHRERGVSMAIAIGRWDDSSTTSDRVCFGLEADEGEHVVLFRFINPDESPWAQTELLGQMISRNQALESESRTDVLAVAEKVVRAHPAISAFLRIA